MWTPRTRNRRAVIVIIGLIATIALAGCAASSKSGNTTSSRVTPERGAQAPGGDQEGGGGALTPAPTSKPLAPGAVQRSIIYDGIITVRVTDVNATAAQAQAFATAAGGYVGGDNREIDAGRSSATLILRVPAIRFDATVNALGQLGHEQNRQVSTQDVTEQVVDIQSRLRTQQASVDRIRALLAQAKSLSEIVSIEGELTRREADLESLEAQMRSLTDLTALSTITVTLLGPDAAVVPVKPAKSTGFISGLKSGWRAFQKSLSALLTIIGAILPFAVAIGGPVLLIIWLARRRRARNPVVRLPAPVGPPVAGMPRMPNVPMAPPVWPVPPAAPTAPRAAPPAPAPAPAPEPDAGEAPDSQE